MDAQEEGGVEDEEGMEDDLVADGGAGGDEAYGTDDDAEMDY